MNRPILEQFYPLFNRPDRQHGIIVILVVVVHVGIVVEVKRVSGTILLTTPHVTAKGISLHVDKLLLTWTTALLEPDPLSGGCPRLMHAQNSLVSSWSLGYLSSDSGWVVAYRENLTMIWTV